MRRGRGAVDVKSILALSIVSHEQMAFGDLVFEINLVVRARTVRPAHILVS